jgi:hypothetical protein
LTFAVSLSNSGSLVNVGLRPVDKRPAPAALPITVPS